MYTFNQVKDGVVKYLDTEVLPNIPDKSWKRMILGMGLALIIDKQSERIYALKDNPVVKLTGIFDDDGNVDVDILVKEMKKQMPKEGIPIDIPVVGGTLRFTESDIDKLQEYITGE